MLQMAAHSGRFGVDDLVAHDRIYVRLVCVYCCVVNDVF